MRPPADLRFADFAPPPRRRVNNVFDGWDGQACIQWPERDPAYRFQYFCLEPMTHLPGGHDSPEKAGFVQLPPGASFRTEIAYEVSLRK